MREAPSGWARGRIGDLIAPDGAFVDGDWIESKDQDPNGHVRLIQLADIGDGVFRNRSSRFLTSTRAEELGCTFLTPGDVLVARMPDPLGRACIFPGVGQPAVTAVDVCVVRPGSLGVDPRWLMWAINDPAFRSRVAELQSGTTRKRISRRNLATIDLLVAPLSEQRRIVAAIEAATSRLEAADQSLGRAARRMVISQRMGVRSALQGAWQSEILADLAIKITKGTTPTSLGRRYTRGGVLFVKAESLSAGSVDRRRCAYIDDETDSLLSRSKLEEHDVLVTIAGTLGRVAIVKACDLPANTNQAISIIRLKDPELAPWVATYLRGPRAQAELLAGGRGVGLQNLNLKQVGGVTVPLPTATERAQIVARIGQEQSAFDAVITAIELARRRSAALRRSILEQAFRGELVPQDPDDEPASVLLERIAAERATADAATGRRPRRRATMHSS